MGIKPATAHEFYASLHARGETTSTLAVKIGCSGGAVRRLITGHRKPAGPIWRRLITLLTEHEKALLNQTVEQCSTWNIQRGRLRPQFTADTARRLNLHS